ncbi:protein-tyrosine phosphatase-like protein [Geopyxis carbonaria]|nr:protein-tyrosine phosphatase-like protein [Geopyxis carbonaria]
MFALRFNDTRLKEEAGITHIVSVIRLPLDHRLFEGYEHLIIEVDDVDEENLLEHFAKTNEFVENALKSGGSVFIHCAMGKSRSATVLAAYLMKTRRISRDEALEVIRECRPFVDPNDGFMKQLELYHQMQYTTALDDNPIYQRWLYQQELEMSRAAGKAPERVHFRDAEQNVARITRMEEGQTPEEIGMVELRCKKCRRALANSQYLSPHIPKPAQPPNPEPSLVKCSHHFLEPLRWMKPELDEGKLEGKLECPKCQSKVGSYAWQGMKCSCGEWIVPGISLARGRVDEIKIPAQRL